MNKILPLSGFPEWLPEERLVEQYFIDRVRQKFELFGFSPIETRSVEPLDRLLLKGETDKEIYVIKRLHADDGEEEAKLGLHFDLTVPFARYVLQHRHALVFPFKRYQIQKAFRGERAQEGRYREFYQADIDVIGENELPLQFDAEMPLLLHEILASFPLPRHKILVNNRHILDGFFRGLGVEDATTTLRIVDKLGKIGEAGVRAMLARDARLDDAVIAKVLALIAIETPDESFAERVAAIGVRHPSLERGIDELRYVMRAAAGLPKGAVVAAMSIARGFDYYTGTVYEAVLEGLESVGAVCSGGRYDNLASAGATQKYPGVGVCVGITRLLGPLFARKMLAPSRPTPTIALVALNDEASRPQSEALVRTLRARGIPTELYHEAAKFGKQIRYAERKGIPFVWFAGEEPEVRDLRAREQTKADPATWLVPEDDREVRVRATPAVAPTDR